VHTNATGHPSEQWVAQQLREAFPAGAQPPKYLICDRDSIFSEHVASVADSMGIRLVRTAPRSPWQNGIAERFIGSVRRELLDHVIVFGPAHLARLLRRYAAYHNEDRPHLSRNKNSPVGRPIEIRPDGGALRSTPRLWGLHHQYSWG
jgi:transposase InsO family protein